MRAQSASGTGTASEETFSFKDILMPYARRAIVLWLTCAAAAATLYRAVRRRSWWRLALNGLGAAFVGLVAGWTIDPGTGLLALVLPVLAWGLPGALIGFRRSRSAREAGLILAAWTVASLVPFLAVRPIG